MAQAADTGAGSGAPFVKMTELGDKLVGAFASDPSKSRRQRRNFETQAPMTKPDGTTPLLEEVMHFVAMPGTTAKQGKQDNLSPVEVGAHVRYSVSGYKWGQVIDARKELPPRAGFAAGQVCSGDVYEITLVGWSAQTDNVAGAQAAGFVIEDGRIIMRTTEDRDKYVLVRVQAGQPANPAKDYTVVVRRPTDDEKRWEQAADELYASKPWESSAPLAPADDDGDPFPAAVEGTPF